MLKRRPRIIFEDTFPIYLSKRIPNNHPSNSNDEIIPMQKPPQSGVINSKPASIRLHGYSLLDSPEPRNIQPIITLERPKLSFRGVPLAERQRECNSLFKEKPKESIISNSDSPNKTKPVNPIMGDIDSLKTPTNTTHVNVEFMDSRRKTSIFSLITMGIIAATTFFVPTNSIKKDSNIQYVPQQIKSTIEITLPEDKIFSLEDNQLKISPKENFDINSYSYAIASYSIEELVSFDSDTQLRLIQRTPNKSEIPYIKSISEILIAYNSSSISSIDLTSSGFNNPSRNRLQGKDLFLPLSANPLIFSYEENSPSTIADDILRITCMVPRAGLSSYIIAASKNGWIPQDFFRISSLPLLTQASLVNHNMPDVTIGTIDDNRLLFDLLSSTIESNLNVFDNPDFSDSGLINPKKNILKIWDQIELNPHYGIELVLESEEDYRDSLSHLEKIALDYSNTMSFSGINYFPDETNQMLKDISLRFASAYNKNQSFDNLPLSYSERLHLARSLYINANNRSDLRTYMTVEEILDSVNLGSEEKISSKDILNSTKFRRSKAVSNNLSERRLNILEDYMYVGSPLRKADFVRNAAEKYGVSESTIYRDLRELNQTAIDPKYLF